MRDSLVTPLRVVSVLDPAIDRAATDLELYAGTNELGRPGDRDATRIVVLPGQTPIWFTLQPITAIMFANSVESQATPNARYLRAFQWACLSVEGLEPGGATLLGDTPINDEMGRGQMIVGERLLNRLADELGLDWLYDIGAVAYQRAKAPKIRGGAVSYTLPPFLRVALSQT